MSPISNEVTCNKLTTFSRRAFGRFLCTLTLCALTLAQGRVSVAQDVETKEFKAQELTLQIPTSWKEQPINNNLRLAQFEIPAVDGDTANAELAVFPPFGGSITENIKRWIAQFHSEGLRADFTQGTVEQGKYVVADMSGTYNLPVGPPIMRKTMPAPGYRVIAVMLTAEKGGSYFLKLTGPEKTVEAAADAFRKSFGADKTKEDKFEF